jgi:octaprenyl-diphosphate synthase
VCSSDLEIKRELIDIVKNKNEEPKSIKRAIELVVASGGIQYAQQKMEEIKNQALDILAEIPESEAKKALVGLVEYTVQRKK